MMPRPASFFTCNCLVSFFSAKRSSGHLVRKMISLAPRGLACRASEHINWLEKGACSELLNHIGLHSEALAAWRRSTHMNLARGSLSTQALTLFGANEMEERVDGTSNGHPVAAKSTILATHSCFSRRRAHVVLAPGCRCCRTSCESFGKSKSARRGPHLPAPVCPYAKTVTL